MTRPSAHPPVVSSAAVAAPEAAPEATPTGDAAATTLWLLERLLHRRAALPPLPVRPHVRRRPSGERGLSLAALEGIGRFYARHGGLAVVALEQVVHGRVLPRWRYRKG